MLRNFSLQGKCRKQEKKSDLVYKTDCVKTRVLSEFEFYSFVYHKTKKLSNLFSRSIVNSTIKSHGPSNALHFEIFFLFMCSAVDKLSRFCREVEAKVPLNILTRRFFAGCVLFVC